MADHSADGTWKRKDSMRTFGRKPPSPGVPQFTAASDAGYGFNLDQLPIVRFEPHLGFSVLTNLCQYALFGGWTPSPQILPPTPFFVPFYPAAKSKTALPGAKKKKNKM